ncbi:MAG: vitamin B12-dependent ribonucleotide reductase [Actinobacteria bacterium]|nr:vitamin B12-dependent ribonucleotide reductase [Actinomycetota bacterium]NCW83583.1 vitamin B12-dependent ribonucleotide reductase [Acidimicrobiia bacterium]NDB41988.1 vitamin B12-dependent ribonucleotide reductase [Actinomycetota bacterium]NDF87985.1 vitamin B12-dependent ribonucleotide reductase [Actinomycetota bacterium]
MSLAPERLSIGIRRHFTAPGVHPYDQVVWERRDAQIKNWKDGSVAFEQLGVEFPVSWSLNATNIVAQKYFRGTPGTPERENSMRQVVDRVADTITKWGTECGYFIDQDEADSFCNELKFILITQRAAFNSPVWFNIGVNGVPQQASACFILAVDDTMDAILNWYKEEGTIFKGGSGAGINLSNIRSSAEHLKGGGTASGPVSFMRGADASAGTIKSGGKTRRAAKMVILNASHPDIEEFIWCKSREEKKARALRDAGFDMDLDGSDSFSVQYQNANNSVRVTDEFMQAVKDDADWNLTAVKDGRVVRTIRARDLWRQIATASWECADPGLQFDTTINKWHTAHAAGRINGSNPCSEYMHIDNSACNLASINLLKYLNDDDTFDVESYMHTIEVMFTAQEILVGNADYPTEKIAENSRLFRQLGLGYANLGALLMALGMPYDSTGGRAWAAALTSLMTGHAYATSARTASRMGPFAGFSANERYMLNVLRMHRDANLEIDNIDVVQPSLVDAATAAWDAAVRDGEEYGVRNSQASVLAPTGTIGLMMDCDTTGIEPDLGLVKFKKLVGGGNMTIVNQTVPRALNQLGYEAPIVDRIVAYIDENKSIVGSPDLKPEHLPVFACSMGDNTIHYEGHVRMMGATQPFLSGAISKTVNMPEEASIEDIEELHMLSWELGVKAVAVYRDNCKVGQPLSTMKKDGEQGSSTGGDASGAATQIVERIVERVVHQPVREKLPRSRRGRTFEFRVADCKGFATIGEYSDGRPGEVFLTVSKQGSTLAGIMDAFAKSISYGLQYGVPMRAFIEAFVNTRFEPAGMTDDPDIRMASSIVDYLFRRLAVEYLTTDERAELGIYTREERMQPTLPGVEESITQTTQGTDVFADPKTIPSASDLVAQIDAGTYSSPPSHGATKAAGTGMICSSCGSANMQRAGACYVCGDCGSSSGCS